MTIVSAYAIGLGYQQLLYCSFQHLFGVQDPLLNMSHKEQSPNIKVYELFHWFLFCFEAGMEYGKEFLVSEQTPQNAGKEQVQDLLRQVQENGRHDLSQLYCQ